MQQDSGSFRGVHVRVGLWFSRFGGGNVVTSSGFKLIPLLWRAGGLILLWWIISGGAVESWWIGVSAIALAVCVSIMLDGGDRQAVRPVALLRFIPYFLFESVRGGVDVARRAFSRNMPLAPAFLNYPLRLPAGRPQVFFANTVSLLPGTLGAGLSDQALNIHMLDHTSVSLAELNRLEQRVATIFGIDITTPSTSL